MALYHPSRCGHSACPRRERLCVSGSCTAQRSRNGTYTASTSETFSPAMNGPPPFLMAASSSPSAVTKSPRKVARSTSLMLVLRALNANLAPAELKVDACSMSSSARVELGGGGIACDGMGELEW